jgi:hypothetical protein
MEDFTLLSVAPAATWEEDLPLVMRTLPHDFNVLRSTNKPTALCSSVLQAKVYDPAKPLTSKQRSDINRARLSVGKYEVNSGTFPSDDDLLLGVRRWNRHGYSGDYFLWQWLWAKAAGKMVCLRGSNYSAWGALVGYGTFNIFTAYYTTGDAPSGVGTAILDLLLATHGNGLPTVLTIPLTEDQERRFGVSKYETYKRRFANDVYSLGCYSGVTSFESAAPPYFDVVRGEEVSVL